MSQLQTVNGREKIMGLCEIIVANIIVFYVLL